VVKGCRSGPVNERCRSSILHSLHQGVEAAVAWCPRRRRRLAARARSMDPRCRVSDLTSCCPSILAGRGAWWTRASLTTSRLRGAGVVVKDSGRGVDRRSCFPPRVDPSARSYYWTERSRRMLCLVERVCCPSATRVKMRCGDESAVDSCDGQVQVQPLRGNTKTKY